MFIITNLYKFLHIFAVCYVQHIKFINENDWFIDEIIGLFKWCISLNSTYIIFLAIFFIILVIPEHIYNKGGKKG